MTSHPTTRMIIFDDGLGQLGPLTHLRAAFEVRTGMHTTAGRIRAYRPKTLGGYWVPASLAALVGSRADAPVNDLPDEEVLLCINGRWAIPDPEMELATGSAVVEESTGHVVAACLRRADAEYFLQTGELHERAHVSRRRQRLLYKYPWDVLSMLSETIPLDIATVRMLDAKVLSGTADVLGSHPVEVHVSTAIGPNVVFDATDGPIIVHEDVTIRPGAILCGPCSIGAGSTVIDRALVKKNTAIGRCCKIAGEVGGTVFQGYSNKGHDGHLGDSWVGKWVNLGAGTTNSNLLNTYGEISVRLEPDGPRHRTGMIFLGAIIGDHVKTAISTRIMTGAVLGTGAMVASTLPPPAAVRPFAWITDDGERAFRLEKFVASTTAMMKRRGKTPSADYLAAVEALYRRTVS